MVDGKYPILNYGYSKEIRDNNKWFAAVAQGDEKVVQNLVEKQGFLRKIKYENAASPWWNDSSACGFTIW